MTLDDKIDQLIDEIQSQCNAIWKELEGKT